MVLRVLKQRINLLKVSKEAKKGAIEVIGHIKKKRPELSKVNGILLFWIYVGN